MPPYIPAPLCPFKFRLAGHFLCRMRLLMNYRRNEWIGKSHSAIRKEIGDDGRYNVLLRPFMKIIRRQNNEMDQDAVVISESVSIATSPMWGRLQSTAMFCFDLEMKELIQLTLAFHRLAYVFIK